MQLRKPPLPALTVKLSKYNVDDVALGVCKTGAEEAGVTEVRDRKSGSAGMPRPISYAVFCLTTKSGWVLDLASLASCIVALDALVVTQARSSLTRALNAPVDQLDWTVHF